MASLAAAWMLAGADYAVQAENPGEWRKLLASFGVEVSEAPARIRIVEGASRAARAAGFAATGENVRVAALVSAHDPDLEIYWEQPREVPVFKVPEGARVFVREKRGGAPLVAGLADGAGGLLWTAAPPGESGYERFPHLIHALVDVGFEPPFRQSRLWAFFDYSYRLRADPEYLARRWREAGFSGLHVSAWHFHEPDAQRDAYLEQLIAACHREAVTVYAWLELPHVSEAFWEHNPQCREQTATLQNAQLDWRKLINLADPACSQKAWRGVKRLLTTFDWDGVNLAELYFESLHGPSNPPRFTPLNAWVRHDALKQLGFDPLELFDPASERSWDRDERSWRAFADYRAALALGLQEQWLARIRAALPAADLVVTQIDDRFDDKMRDHLGADAAALLPLALEYGFTLLIEDPATLWSLGPERYAEIADRYLPLTDDPARLAIDINIVERYQHAYPTRKQVGGEVFRLTGEAAQAFPRTALYFEHSIARPDWDLLSHAGAAARLAARDGRSISVEGGKPFGVQWDGAAAVNGEPWPVTDGRTLWLPAGKHRVEPSAEVPPGRMLYLNADLTGASAGADVIRFSYSSAARAVALLDRRPAAVEVDGTEVQAPLQQARRHWALTLPRGVHEAVLRY